MLVGKLLRAGLVALLAAPSSVSAAEGNEAFDSDPESVEDLEVEQEEDAPEEISGDTPNIPLRVEISGTRDCPTNEQFLRTIIERTSHARRAEGGELAWSLELSVEPKGRSRQAQLVMRATEGPWVKREVIAPNCRQALDALSLVVAILVETAAEQMATLREQGAKDGERPRTVAPLPVVAAGVWIPWLDDPYFFEKRGERPVVTRSSFTAFFGLEVDWSLRPDPTIEYSAGLEWSEWHPELLDPSYAMALTWAAGDIERHGIDARIDRVLLRLEGCPADFIPSSSVDLRPCLRLDGGVIATRIQRRIDPDIDAQRDESFTAKFGPALRFSVAASSRLFIVTTGGLDMHLARRQVAAHTPNGTIRAYRSSLTNGYVGLGVGIGL